MSWLKRKSSRLLSVERLTESSGQRSGKQVGLDARSQFSYVESLEFWPELDDDLSSFAVRPTYPGNEHGVVRGEQGEYVVALGAVKHFKMNRSIGASCWASVSRWEGREVHDLAWATPGGEGALTLAGSPVSVDLSPDGRLIAHLSWVDGQARLDLVDLRSGSVTELVAFSRDQASGGEMVRWSPDSRFVLLSGNPIGSPFLILASSGAMVELPWPGQASWWPDASGAALLLSETQIDATTTLSRVELGTATKYFLGAIEAPAEMPRQDGVTRVFNLDVSPDGRGFVGYGLFGAVSYLGSPHAGGRGKWVQGTLPLGSGDGPPRILRWSPEWCWRENPSLELVHRDVRYAETAPSGAIEIDRSLLP